MSLLKPGQHVPLVQLEGRRFVIVHETHCLELLETWFPLAYFLCKLSVCYPGGLGGAVAVDTSQATVGGSVFSDNSAKSQGGALYQVSKSIASLWKPAYLAFGHQGC